MVIVDEHSFILKALEEKGFEIFDFFENPKVYSLKEFSELPLQRRNELLLVDTQTVMKSPELVEKFQTVMNTYVGVIYFYDQKNTEAGTWLQDKAAFLNKIIGEFALPMPQLSWSILSNQLQYFWSLINEQKKLQSHITKFSQELDQVLASAEGQMLKAKQIHETLIPKRQDEIKGVKFMNKYSSGDGGGGEFYDLHQEGGKVYQILLSSQSYLISSSLLGILAQYKEKSFKPEVFIQDCLKEIETINGPKKKKSEADVMVYELDTMTMLMKTHGQGKTEVYSQEQGLITDEETRLIRGDKLIILSSGFIYNWKENHPKKTIYEFLQEHKDSTQSDLLNELFFQISQKKDSEFLQRDAIAAMMEVNRHGIHKV
jgi:hypothetical protein